MIKKNKWKLLISSIVTLLPVLAGLILRDSLPEQMATHWGVGGMADGFGSRFFAVLAPPLSMLVLHWICIIVTAVDPRNKNQTEKAIGLTFWIVPMVSLFVSAIVYAAAFGVKFDINIITLIFLGLMFMVIGNYLPKCKQNYTLGIKVKWTIENEENWNATHRFCGKVWAACGFLLLLAVFLPKSARPYAMMLSVPIIVVVPIVYSYAYHRRQLKSGTAITNKPVTKQNKRITLIAACVTFIILLGCGYLTISGNIVLQYKETAFTIETTYMGDKTVDYADIEAIEYREHDTAGARTSGFGSLRLQMGLYQNEEFGHYTRYTYTFCDPCVVLTVNGKTLVINGIDAESTKAIYNELISKTNRL